jgi:hypothetical protein
LQYTPWFLFAFRAKYEKCLCSELSSGIYCRVKWLSADGMKSVRTSETSVDNLLHGSISQKTTLNIILAAVRTWNLTEKLSLKQTEIARTPTGSQFLWLHTSFVLYTVSLNNPLTIMSCSPSYLCLPTVLPTDKLFALQPSSETSPACVPHTRSQTVTSWLYSPAIC